LHGKLTTNLLISNNFIDNPDESIVSNNPYANKSYDIVRRGL